MAIDKQGAKDSLFGNLKKAAEQTKADDQVLEVSLHKEKPVELEITAPVGREEPAVEIETIPTEQKHHVEPGQQETKTSHVPKSKAKYQDLDKVTVLMTKEQKSGLDIAAKNIMRYRARHTKGVEDKERITTNTLIRALIDNFLVNEPALEVLTCEDDVLEWVGKVFRDNS